MKALVLLIATFSYREPKTKAEALRAKLRHSHPPGQSQLVEIPTYSSPNFSILCFLPGRFNLGTKAFPAFDSHRRCENAVTNGFSFLTLKKMC